jgi:excisionase family DNA binding protein
VSSTVWLTPAEAATYARVNVVTLRRAVRAGKLIAFKVNAGRNLRFRRSDLDAWLASSPVEAR